MATVRLGTYEVEEYGLPSTCARCGGRAVVSPPKRFRWSPPWLPVLILLGALGLLLFIILSLSLAKTRTVPLPLCERHRHYWRNRNLFYFGGLLGVVVFGTLAIALGIVLDDHGISETALLISILATVGLFLTWLIAAAIVQSMSIRASEITDHAISLTGLSSEFREDVREARRGDEEDDDEPRPRRRRRDEDDEDRPRPRRREASDDGGYYDPDEKKPRRRPPPDAIEEGDDR